MSGRGKGSKKSKKGKAPRSTMGPATIGAPTDGRVVSVPLRAQQQRKWTVKAYDQINVGLLSVTTWASSGNNVVSLANTWLQNSALWTDIQALSDEYRIDWVRVHGVPLNRYNRPTTQNICSFALALDADGVVGTNATSYQQVLAYTTARVCAFSDPFEIQWNVPQAAANIFYDVAGIGGATAQPTELFFFPDGLQTASIGPVMGVIWELGVTTRGTRQ